MSTEGSEPPRHRRRSPLRLVLVVGAILLVEAVSIIGAMMLVGGPADVAATPPPASIETPEEERIVEIQILDAQLPNSKSGVTYLYATEIYVQVKQRHADRVTDELDQFRNEIKSEITAIWRTAELRHFREARTETLTRQVHSMLSDRFGVDRERDEPIISKCVIVMGTGYRVDG